MSDLDRLRAEYADRARRFSAESPYNNATNDYLAEQRRRSIFATLDREQLHPLADKQLLEVGCGESGVLSEWLTFGLNPQNIYGIDLLSSRVAIGQHKFPQFNLAVADGQTLPFPSCSFDIVLQFTALSSILDRRIRLQMASEMQRIVKQGGIIISYDFWLNPTNPHTIGITRAELGRLFQGCTIRTQRITLAPPLARRITPRFKIAATILERIRLFNSHFLATIYN